MPAETAPHERAWMAWPASGYVLGDGPAEAEEARTAWAAVANAIVDHEPLSMLVTADGRSQARRRLSAAVVLQDCRLDDAWYRDTGPTFVLGEGGRLGAVNWVFILVTETVQLDPLRNPGWTKADVEAELARTVGATTVIWLPRGLTRDSQAYGTRGHVDIVATFTGPGRVLLHDQRDPAPTMRSVPNSVHCCPEPPTPPAAPSP